MSTTTTKFCVDCKHYNSGPCDIGMCHHPEHGWEYRETVSVVTGKKTPGLHKMCCDARHANNTHLCGPMGNLWEAKEPVTYKSLYRKIIDWIHER